MPEESLLEILKQSLSRKKLTITINIDESIAFLVVNYLQDKELDEVNIYSSFSNEGLTIFLNFLTSKGITKIGIFKDGFSDAQRSEKFIQFLQQNTQLTSIRLIDFVTEDNFQSFCEALKNHSNLQNLTLINDINLPITTAVFKHLEAVNCVKLTLSNFLTDGMVPEIFYPGHSLKPKALSIIELERKNLNAASVKIIASNLGSTVKKLAFFLDPGVYHDSENLIIALIDGLKDNNTLINLDISTNNIGTEGAKKLGEFLLKNKSIKKLTLDSNEKFDANAIKATLKENQTLEILSLKNNLNTNNYISWFEAIKESHLSKVCLSYPLPVLQNGLYMLTEYIKATPTLQNVIMTHLYTNHHLNSLYENGFTNFMGALEQNRKGIIKCKHIAKKMVALNEQFLLSSENKINIQNVDLSQVNLVDPSKFVNIAFLWAIEQRDSNALNGVLRTNAYLYKGFLDNYKNNNGFVLTGVHKSKSDFEPKSDGEVSKLVFLPPEIWFDIFSYLTVQDMYKIVCTKTSSKVEEVFDEVPNVGEIHEQNEHA